jgi:transcription initiation factor TFIIH subunit 2
MFPVPVFRERSAGVAGSGKGVAAAADDHDSARCFGCQVEIDSTDGSALQTECPKCHTVFCVECDIFIHDSLHNCPGCSR